MTIGTARAIAAHSRTAALRNQYHEQRNTPPAPKEGDHLSAAERLFCILAGGTAVGVLGLFGTTFGMGTGMVIADVKIVSDLQSYITPDGMASAQTVLNHWELPGGLIGGFFGVKKALGIDGLRNCLKAGFTGKEPPRPQP